MLNRDFGEALVDKKDPAIFIFDLQKNVLNQVQGLTKDVHPMCPIFDQENTGVVFSGVYHPNFKLGLSYCTNRPTHLYYIREPIFDKKKLTESGNGATDISYMQMLNPESEYIAMRPRFSHDFTKLVYLGSDIKFLSHTGNY